MNILIVEDDEQTHAALMNLVRRMGFNPRGARTGGEAIDEVLRSAPQVLITDWDLGERLSGVEVAALAQDRRDSCRVVFCSGNNMALLRQRTSHLHHCSFIRKPSSLAQLRQEFRVILDTACCQGI
ncbi:response regulator [Granulosicoccus sp. 3-233]|uniref:response regulator n=1 Tax=Granulosicoccus sp. 3-233 TaxID=3417969 RepID=UPI003D3388C8